MKLQLSFEILELRTRHDFHIARAAAPPARRNVWVRVRDPDGLEGWGAAAPNAYYAETADTVVEALHTYQQHLDGDVATLERRLLEALPAPPKFPPHPSARSAISAALYDLLGKRAGQPVWRLLNLSNRTPVSSFTIGIDEPEVMRAKTREAAGYPILKVKLGTDRDEQILQLLRDEAPNTTIRVDANTGWTAQQAIALLPMLEDYKVELIEQPVPADDYEGLMAIRRAARIPIIADESCRVASDVEVLKGCVDGVNIKLAKCGSLGEALRIAAAARAHDMQVMLGCMIESTLGIAAAVQLASLADYVDLDGAALLANDPFSGPGVDEHGRVVFNDAAGLGVTLR